MTFSSGRAHALQFVLSILVSLPCVSVSAVETTRSRLSDRTYVFSRSQLKYGLEKDNYLSRWVDRPLYVDPSLRTEATANERINSLSYRRMQKTAQEYGLDGFAFFPESSGRSEVHALPSPESGTSFHLLTEFSARGDDTEKIRLAGLALANPQSLRLNGKVVLSSYVADSKPPKYWQELLEKIGAQHGDNFLFLPALNNFGGRSLSEWVSLFEKNAISDEDRDRIKDTLREWLAATDGLYFAQVAGVKKDRLFYPEFYRDFIIRYMKEVLTEPAYHGKYFALAANVGHENCTRFGYTQSSNGTKTLRQSLEAAIEAEPEIINIPEWDEQNENTSLRPTVYNSLSSLRILRYYMAKIRGEQPRFVAGDDPGVPNLILSYRKILTAGEKIEVEILNIPDTIPTGDAASVTFTARLNLLASDGSIAFTSPELSFDKNRLMDRTVVIPAETLAAHQVLLPSLDVTEKSGTRTFAEGLHYIELRPTWNWDYKWVKQPLRDLLACQTAELKVSEPASDGLRLVDVVVSADETLAYVEVLDGDDVIYSHQTAENSARENDKDAVLSITWQSLRLTKLRGSITLKNASGRWLLPEDGALVLTDQTLNLDGQRSNTWMKRVLVAVPKDQLSAAEFTINMPGIFEGTIPLSQIMRDSAYGIPGNDGFNMILSRYVRQNRMPLHLDKTEARFSVPVLADLPASIYHVQLVAKSGRTYRSAPFLVGGTAAPRVTTRVYSDTAAQALKITAPGLEIPDIVYEFDPAHGSILYTRAGRPFWGILGGFVSQVTERGGAEARDGTPFLREADYPAKASVTHPAWVKSDNGYALQFDGKGTFVALPQGVIPRRSAFTISMDLKPADTAGEQVLIANRSYYPGSFTIFLQGGILKASFLGENESVPSFNSGARLEADQWSHLVIRYDGSELVFLVNGVPSKPLPIKGPGLYDTVSVLGGFGTSWFHGEIKSLRIQHFAQTQK